MHPADLEALADRRLRQLPAPRAPQTLLPRVMAAVQEWTLRPWYSRAWFTWPRGWQVASIAALMLVVAGTVVLLPSGKAAATEAASPWAALVTSRVADLAARTEMTVNAARVLWRTLVEPLVVYAFALVVLMGLACVVFGTALSHVVMERAVQR